MTGTGRRRWMIGVAVLVAVAVALAAWLVRRDGDGTAAGTDTTPTSELLWVQRLAELVGVDGESGASPTAIGAALGDVVSLLRSPQDLDAFTAEHGTGPLDMASQLGTTLASIMYDVASPAACGRRAEELRSDDTLFVLGISAAAVPVIERDQDPVAVASLVLPGAIESDQRETIAERVAAGEIESAARAVEDELGDDAAPELVRALVEEVTGLLAADDGADYRASFLSSYDFTIAVQTAGTDCG